MAASPPPTWASRAGVPRVEHHAELPSTMDRAHALAAAGAADGTVVLADAQTAGRGRQGRVWASAPGAGLWLTVVVRPPSGRGVGVLSCRAGLALAAVLDPFAPSPVRVKWPNDLYVGAAKLGGVLIEARWRGDQLDWVAIGVGINLRPPQGVAGAALRDGVDRDAVLEALVPALRRAASNEGPLGPDELVAWRARDLLAGRRLRAPVVGVVQGLAPDGALRVLGPDGVERPVRDASVEWEDAPPSLPADLPN